MPSVQSRPAAVTLKTTAAIIAPPVLSKRIVADPAWLGQAASDPDSSDLHHKKEIAILALDAVFAQYGR